MTSISPKNNAKSNNNVNKKFSLTTKIERIHSLKVSLFSRDQSNIEFFGLINMCVLLLILSNFRSSLIIISREGLLINIFHMNPFSPDNLSLILKTITILSGFSIISYVIELILSRKHITEIQGYALYTSNMVMLMMYPICHINGKIEDPLISTVKMCLYTTCVLKLYSYHTVNYWLRSGEKVFVGISKTDTIYPNNLTIKNLFYFLYLPTFCYEINFPKTDCVRPFFLLKRFFEIIFLNAIILATFQQSILPFLLKTYDTKADNVLVKLLTTIEDVLVISSPNFIIWLLFFYVTFHSTMNAWAELMYFGDREFYNDWWNASSVAYFWKNWNMPIYRFCKRHIYIPLLEKGCNQITASIIVFLLSAFFHEYIVSASLGIFSYWAFLAMITQIPLHFFIEKLPNKTLKNVMFWLSLMIGQPLAITMYFREYVQTNNVTSIMGINIPSK